MSLDHVVFRLSLGVGYVFLRSEAVFDYFEYSFVGGQREHSHDHAFDTGRDDEFIVGDIEMVEKSAIKLGLAVFMQSD